MSCAQPRPPLSHLQFACHASGHLLSPIIVIYKVVLYVLQDCELNSQWPPRSHLVHANVPDLCFLLVKPFESSVVFVAGASQGNPQDSSLCSKEDHSECLTRECEQLTAVVCGGKCLTTGSEEGDEGGGLILSVCWF